MKKIRCVAIYGPHIGNEAHVTQLGHMGLTERPSLDTRRHGPLRHAYTCNTVRPVFGQAAQARHKVTLTGNLQKPFHNSLDV